MTTLDLVGFAKAVMSRWPEGGCDGGDLQELGEKFGLLVPEQRTAFCEPDACCPCNWVVDHPEQGFTCYRRQPLEAKE